MQVYQENPDSAKKSKKIYIILTDFSANIHTRNGNTGISSYHNIPFEAATGPDCRLPYAQTVLRCTTCG